MQYLGTSYTYHTTRQIVKIYKFFQAFILVCLAEFVRSWTIIEGTGCYEEMIRGSVFTAVPSADNDVITVAKCIDACPTLSQNFTHVGLTYGKTCMCGTLPSTGRKLFTCTAARGSWSERQNKSVKNFIPYICQAGQVYGILVLPHFFIFSALVFALGTSSLQVILVQLIHRPTL